MIGGGHPESVGNATEPTVGHPMNTADRLFAARLYAATYLIQNSRPAELADVMGARGCTLGEAFAALIGLDRSRIVQRITQRRQAQRRDTA